MLRLCLQSSGCCCGFVFELKVVNQLRNGIDCVHGTELGAIGQLTHYSGISCDLLQENG